MIIMLHNEFDIKFNCPFFIIEYGVITETFLVSEDADADSIRVDCRFFLKDLSILSFSLDSRAKGISVVSDLVLAFKGKLISSV